MLDIISLNEWYKKKKRLPVGFAVPSFNHFYFMRTKICQHFHKIVVFIASLSLSGALLSAPLLTGRDPVSLPDGGITDYTMTEKTIHFNLTDENS